MPSSAGARPGSFVSSNSSDLQVTTSASPENHGLGVTTCFVQAPSTMKCSRVLTSVVSLSTVTGGSRTRSGTRRSHVPARAPLGFARPRMDLVLYGVHRTPKWLGSNRHEVIVLRAAIGWGQLQPVKGYATTEREGVAQFRDREDLHEGAMDDKSLFDLLAQRTQGTGTPSSDGCRWTSRRPRPSRS